MKIFIRHEDPSSRSVLNVTLDGKHENKLLPGQSMTVNASQIAIAESYEISEDDENDDQITA